MDPLAREVLKRGQSAHDPTPDDKARVKAKVSAAMAVAGGAAAALKPGIARTTWSWIMKGGLAILVVGAAATAVTMSARSAPAGGLPAAPETVSAPGSGAPSAMPETPAADPPADTATATAPVESPPPQPTASAVAPASAHSSKVSSAGDLEGEVALLARAQAAIQQGDFTTALARLDEHQRSYPNGALGEERTAARVVALCGAGRQSEARTLAASFLARHPSSPLAPRVKSACGTP